MASVANPKLAAAPGTAPRPPMGGILRLLRGTHPIERPANLVSARGDRIRKSRRALEARIRGRETRHRPLCPSGRRTLVRRRPRRDRALGRRSGPAIHESERRPKNDGRLGRRRRNEGRHAELAPCLRRPSAWSRRSAGAAADARPGPDRRDRRAPAPEVAATGGSRPEGDFPTNSIRLHVAFPFRHSIPRRGRTEDPAARRTAVGGIREGCGSFA